MSNDTKLFKAPERYPEAPKDMYYQVPPKTPTIERPKPIFPWEEHQTRPTRVFAEDAISPPLEATPSVTTDDGSQDDDTLTPTTPTIQVTTEPFASYSRTNAWDEVPEIERYIANLPQNRRGKIQVLVSTTATNESGSSPEGSNPAQSQRRPSMKLTDFPTEIERPSLPVTPAPIRRPSFWGQERDASGELPGAEGVPEQADWDPTAKLAELQRRQSEVLAQGPTGPTRYIPDRQLPGSAAAITIAEESAPSSAPVFGALSFEGGNSARSGQDEGVFSPTES
jgi:glycogenin glucosyltransferase